MRPLLTFALLTCLVSGATTAAANPPDLNALAAKAAAKVQSIIPNTKSQVQGATAIIKKNTVMAPDFEFQGSHLMALNGGKSTEKPSDKGVMMIIQFSNLPYNGPSMPAAPQLDPKRAQHAVSFFHTGALQQFPTKNVAMSVQILFGPYTDIPPVQRAYAELSRLVTAELGH